MITRTHQRDFWTKATAIYSDCERYRYRLLIEWDASRPQAAVIGLNPSTATEQANDPTITRLERWARRNGYGCLAMYNAYGFRSTYPDGLWEIADPAGPDNDLFLRAEMCRDNAVVCAAWGTNIKAQRQAEILEMADRSRCELLCWRLTKKGHPQHPLYLSDATLDRPFAFTAVTSR